MKKSFLFILIFVVSLTLYADISYTQQNVLKSFVSQVSKIVATWAHPTPEYIKSSVSVEGNKAILSIVYRSRWNNERIYTDIVISVDESTGILDDIYVKRDTAFIGAFDGITVFKEIITEMLKKEDSDDNNKEKNQILEVLREKWKSLDGKQLCHLILLYYWIDKDYRDAFIQKQ